MLRKLVERALAWRMAILALLRNRSRSLLTMLGVVIGVAAVIVTVAIGTGARTSVSFTPISLFVPSQIESNRLPW